MGRDDYGKLDKTEIDLEERKGFFDVPEQVQGKTDRGPRDFLVFYFDNDEDYETVLNRLSIKNSKARSHPDMDGHRLAELCRRLE